MTITEHMRVPPWGYRLLARSGGKPMQVARLMERSGLNARMLQRLSVKKGWGGVKIGVADRFIMGCGYDPMKPGVAWRELARLTGNGLGKARYLRKLRRNGESISTLDSSVRARQICRVAKVLGKI